MSPKSSVGIIASPNAATFCFWVALFVWPKLVFSNAAAAIWLLLLCMSFIAWVAGVVYFCFQPKTWHGRVVLAATVLGIAVNAFGFVFALGTAIRAFM